jgi:hypothetical protein
MSFAGTQVQQLPGPTSSMSLLLSCSSTAGVCVVCVIVLEVCVVTPSGLIFAVLFVRHPSFQ